MVSVLLAHAVFFCSEVVSLPVQKLKTCHENLWLLFQESKSTVVQSREHCGSAGGLQGSSRLAPVIPRCSSVSKPGKKIFILNFHSAGQDVRQTGADGLVIS